MSWRLFEKLLSDDLVFKKDPRLSAEEALGHDGRESGCGAHAQEATPPPAPTPKAGRKTKVQTARGGEATDGKGVFVTTQPPVWLRSVVLIKSRRCE